MTIAIVVLLACFGLFYLDYETRSVADLFTTGNLVVLGIYYIPTLILCLSLMLLFTKKFSLSKSMALSLITGIPTGFVIVISLLIF